MRISNQYNSKIKIKSAFQTKAMAHLIEAPGPGSLMTPVTSEALKSQNDFNDNDDAMDIDAHIVEDPYAEIASLNALVSPNEKQFELFVTKVRQSVWPDMAKFRHFGNIL